MDYVGRGMNGSINGVRGVKMRKHYILLSLILISIVLTGCATKSVNKNKVTISNKTSKPSGTAETRIDKRIYTDKDYHIVFEFPSSWKENSLYYPSRFDGVDGFVQYSAISGSGLSIDEVTDLDANHKLRPYGTKPQIKKQVIEGLEARLIKPSEDQPEEMNKQAGLIIKSPQTIKINENYYNYIEIWSDINHIEEIAKSIRFI